MVTPFSGRSARHHYCIAKLYYLSSLLSSSCGNDRLEPCFVDRFLVEKFFRQGVEKGATLHKHLPRRIVPGRECRSHCFINVLLGIFTVFACHHLLGGWPHDARAPVLVSATLRYRSDMP